MVFHLSTIAMMHGPINIRFTRKWSAAVGYELKPLRYKLKPEGFELEELFYRFIQKIWHYG